MTNIRILLWLFFFGWQCFLYAQLPVSKVFLFDVEWTNQQPSFSSPRFVSNFNSDGYNNQLFFLDNFNFLLSSDEKLEGITDIIHADLLTNKYRNITQSLTPEYSPFWSKSSNRLYVIRVEEQQPAVQRLVSIDTSGYLPDEYVLPLENVGYFLLRPPNQVVVFLVDDINRLEIHHSQNSHTTELITMNPGRCFKVNAEDLLYYVHKVSDEQWFLKTFNWKYVGRVLAQMPTDVEDFELDMFDRVYCGKDSQLLRLNPSDAEGWIPIADFSDYGIDNIKRLYWSPDYKRLALIHHEK
jgi:hypothetical protein